MSETMSNVERGLWRIAELGARCSQQSAAGSRAPLWAELEQTIARLDAEFEAARQAVDIAPAQVRSLEGRLDVARKERDREKARAEECFVDAEAARRERDRERARAGRATIVANEAKAAAAEAQAAAAKAHAAAADAAARATAVQAALDQAVKARDELVAGLDETVAARDRANAALDDAEECIATLEARITALEADVETARAERDSVRVDREALRAERDAVVAAQKAATDDRDDALDTLAARADGAVVILPGVNLPEAEVGPLTPHARVSWRPTWSEWADADDDPAAGIDVDTGADAVDGADDHDDGTSLFGPAEEDAGLRRYLNVAATIGNMLPEDLGPLLLAGATVVRREGRRFATVAVTSNQWAAPGAEDEKQALKLADAGFRVEWTTDAPLAC